jgi:16S rRNA (guanine966-N2)-methyltransferase
VRPTADRVKEATFNALGSLGLLEGATVLDLFAGTGALGIEALSRGAARATFVERSAEIAEIVEANLAATGLTDRAEVRVGEATRFVGSGPPAVDLALLDPPYDFEGWAGLLEALPATVAVIESDRPPVVPEGWVVLREQQYGGTVVTIIRRTGPTPGVQT